MPDGLVLPSRSRSSCGSPAVPQPPTSRKQAQCEQPKDGAARLWRRDGADEAIRRVGGVARREIKDVRRTGTRAVTERQAPQLLFAERRTPIEPDLTLQNTAQGIGVDCAVAGVISDE